MDLVHQLNISSGDTCGSSFQKKPSLPLPLLIRKRDDTIFGQHFPIGSPLTSMCVCFTRMGRLGANRPVGSTNRSLQSAAPSDQGVNVASNVRLHPWKSWLDFFTPCSLSAGCAINQTLAIFILARKFQSLATHYGPNAPKTIELDPNAASFICFRYE